MRSNQPCLAITYVDVAFRYLCAPGTQALDLPAFERKTCLEPVLDEVIVTCPLVGGNYVALVRLLLAHLGRTAVGVEGAGLYGIM